MNTLTETRLQQCRLCLTIANSKKNLWALLQGRQPKWFFLILAIFHNHFEFVPISRERVVPTERQVRTVLVDCMSKAKVISIQTPRYRQFALISDFLDLAHLSTREEQNHPRIGSKTDPKGWNFRILCCPLLQAQQYAVIRRMWRQMFGTLLNNASHRAQGNNCSFTGIHLQLQGLFFTEYVSSSTSFFAEYAVWVLYDTTRHSRRQLWHLCCQRWIHRLGTILEKSVQDQLAFVL